MIKGRRWVVAGAVAVVAAVATAVTTQQLIGDSSGTLFLTTSAAPQQPVTAISAATSTAPSTATPTRSRASRSKPVTRAATPSPTAKPAKARKKTSESSAPRLEAAAPRVAAGGALGTGRIKYNVTYSGVATFYGATGAGNCSFPASSSRMIAAMNHADYENSQACGATVKVTSGGKSVTVKIVDRCPECPPGAIDLSQEAFTQLAPASAGRIDITWQLLSPSSLGPVQYVYKSGSSKYWCGIQVRNNRNPVRSVQVQTSGSWKTLSRQEYNYFLSENGAGCGGTIRVTDIYGNQLTDSGIGISPDTVQAGRAQFGSPA